MFLCEECHLHDKCFSGMMLSHGRCEACGKVSGCADCHNYDPNAPCNPPKAPEPVKKQRAGVE